MFRNFGRTRTQCLRQAPDGASTHLLSRDAAEILRTAPKIAVRLTAATGFCLTTATRIVDFITRLLDSRL
jgi:hypothetical protein